MSDDTRPLWRVYNDNRGSYPVIETPDKLWERACAYFKWCDANPIKELKLLNNKPKALKVPMDKAHLYTYEGLFLYIGVSKFEWEEWLQDEEMKHTCDMIDNVIREQDLSWAAAGLSNVQVVSKILGLTDQIETKASGDIKINLTPADDQLV